jgi:hypothetical protein
VADGGGWLGILNAGVELGEEGGRGGLRKGREGEKLLKEIRDWGKIDVLIFVMLVWTT